MGVLKEYVVTVALNDWDDIFLVSAKNAKDAVDIVWSDVFEPRKEWDRKHGYRPTAKYELHAKSVGSLHNRDGKVVCLH